MSRSQRLAGLELLDLIGAPVPHWQIVRTTGDIRSLVFPPTDCGWTIRTCRTDGRREIGLFYLNYAHPSRVIRTLHRLLKDRTGLWSYLVYPSWRFRFACNVLMEEHTLWIEGRFGSQKSLSMGKASPHFSMTIPFFLRSRMKSSTGTPGELVRGWIGKILRWCRCIPADSYYTEVALTHRTELVFYDLFLLGHEKGGVRATTPCFSLPRKPLGLLSHVSRSTGLPNTP